MSEVISVNYTAPEVKKWPPPDSPNVMNITADVPRRTTSKERKPKRPQLARLNTDLPLRKTSNTRRDRTVGMVDEDPERARRVKELVSEIDILRRDVEQIRRERRVGEGNASLSSAPPPSYSHVG